MDKYKRMQQFARQGIVAVVRGRSMEDGIRIADACIAGGVKAIELAFTTPRAQEAIRELVWKYRSDDEVIIGAGTVLEPITARIAILEGAQFVVSPSFDEETVRMCNLYRIVSCPGIMTPAEAVQALRAGADILKVFPGDIVGTKMIKDIRGPLPQASLMPSGGVDVDNVADWLHAGCVAISAGGSLTGAAKKGDYASVTEKAKAFVCAVERARE
ncbi:bifunctional 2-keto-4-hydroxyglutarate aldolase/2-keto-3-deoxy-6-phosphogluconate aldolase [uncultured Mitsuokella sp.]|uniref:bifunctional 2-keto-4-hydroxyglutarate aldolase/2-keto-3-deoxy-6-phosphogluconate aldolase n=1 Tax=uncultured Mitsuokella sp. TaxID=453120 RepID=UPI002605510B|nr:bifunctional 2-keto-4-hydroxyglutarate aldolase/2-keto-3-deoxy-6-phosphogluconate aldolase [uncultured Mitsuokella sp.]